MWAWPAFLPTTLTSRKKRNELEINEMKVINNIIATT